MQVYSLLSVFVRNIQGLIKCIMLILLKFQAVSIMWLIRNESWFAELLILKADDSFAKYIMLNFSISTSFPYHFTAPHFPLCTPFRSFTSKEPEYANEKLRRNPLNNTSEHSLTCSPSRPIILGIDGPQISISSRATWKTNQPTCPTGDKVAQGCLQRRSHAMKSFQQGSYT